jgi:hypothetical protein
MTFQTAVWAVNGNQVDAAYARLMLQAATLGAQGTVGHLDCQVNATTPSPTAGLVITPGQVTILGQEAAYQGSYYGFNIGNDTTLSIAATGGAIRSDMIVARAEDPTWSGSPWGNPASGQIIFPRVISGVAAGSVVPPAGQSCIPLARIDMPASTSVVQQSYIHDLRNVAVPQIQTVQFAVSGPGSPSNWNTAGAVTAWPPGATFTVGIPAFATQMVIAWSVNEIVWSSGWARANLWPIIGPSVGSPVVTTPQSLVSIPAAQGPFRHTIGGGGTVNIPPSIRNTVQTIRFAEQSAGQTGVMYADEGSSVTVIATFQQLATLA